VEKSIEIVMPLTHAEYGRWGTPTAAVHLLITSLVFFRAAPLETFYSLFIASEIDGKNKLPMAPARGSKRLFQRRLYVAAVSRIHRAALVIFVAIPGLRDHFTAWGKLLPSPLALLVAVEAPDLVQSIAFLSCGAPPPPAVEDAS
jgi:hypothetical protein